MSKKKTKEEIIESIKKIPNINYNLEKTIFNGSNTKVCVICPKHGEYLIRIDSLKRGCRCKKCSSRRYSRTGKEIKELSNIIHKNKYSYPNLDDDEKYTNDEKIKIICHKHGMFEQDVYSHLRGKGCWHCGHEKNRESNKRTYESFVENAQKKHNNFYLYVKDSFVNMQEKMKIICPKHGEFFQQPSQHLFGSGCPICASSKLEKDILTSLEKNNIRYIREATSSTLPFLKRYRLDFYLPDYNVGIECQGLQHFKRVDFFEKKDGERMKRDNIKHELCKKNGIKIFYFSNLGIDYPYDVYEDFDKMLIEIKNYAYFETMKEVLCETKQ